MEDPSTWPIRRLKSTLDAARVGYGDCSEKRELVERVKKVLESEDKAPRQPASTGRRPSPKTGEEAPRRRSSSSGGAATGDIGRILSCDPTDLYAILDVTETASAEALKKAYRRLALKLHPDKCQAPGGDEAFKRVSAAFATLSDPKQRRHHDYFGGGGTGEASSSGASAHAYASGFGDVDAEELFRCFFGADDDDESSTAVAAGDYSPEALVQRAANAVGVCKRLGKTFVANPWTLVTALSGLISLSNVIGSLVDKFGTKLVVMAPLAGLALAKAPPTHRRTIILTILAILCSGLL